MNGNWTEAAVTWPRVWTASLKSARLAIVLAIVITLLCALALLMTSEISERVLFLSFGTLILSFGGLAPLGLFWPRKSGLSSRVVDAGQDRAVTLLAHRRGTVVVVGSAYFGIYASFAVLAVDIPMLPEPEIVTIFDLVGRLLPIPLAIYVGVCVVRFFLFLFSKRRISGIGLCPDGIYHWSWGACRFYSWDSIRDFVNVPKRFQLPVKIEYAYLSDRPHDPEENWLGRLRWRKEQQRTVLLALLPVHPALAYQALFFYLQHPELRHELGTDKVEDRLRTGDFPDIIEQIKNHGRALSKQEAQRERRRSST